jgi:hypothetical protein
MTNFFCKSYNRKCPDRADQKGGFARFRPFSVPTPGENVEFAEFQAGNWAAAVAFAWSIAIPQHGAH